MGEKYGFSTLLRLLHVIVINSRSVRCLFYPRRKRITPRWQTLCQSNCRWMEAAENIDVWSRREQKLQLHLRLVHLAQIKQRFVFVSLLLATADKTRCRRHCYLCISLIRPICQFPLNSWSHGALTNRWNTAAGSLTRPVTSGLRGSGACVRVAVLTRVTLLSFSVN